MIPPDSLAVFSQHWNMWKKLVFYISQLVASSAGWPVTPHRDSNAHKGSVPNKQTAFPEKRERGRKSLTKGDLCSATYGKRYRVFYSHACLLRLTQRRGCCGHTSSQRGEEVACEANPILKWNIGSKGVLCSTSSTPVPKKIWRLGLIYILIHSCCITSGAHYGVHMRLWKGGGEWMDRQL